VDCYTIENTDIGNNIHFIVVGGRRFFEQAIAQLSAVRIKDRSYPAQ
jgi:hypothetical protein